MVLDRVQKRFRPSALRWLLVTSTAFGWGCGTPPAPSFAGAPVYRADAHFSVIGDLQRTMFWGKIAMAEQNDAERHLLLGELASSSPAFVVMVGDLVADGSSSGHWKEFDERSEVLRSAKIPVFAVPGNHEYLFGGAPNLARHFFARFPHLDNQNWYARRFGNLGLVFLDSNFGQLSREKWDCQRRWYETTLKLFDDDRTIRGVVVFLHHAPFTDSSLVQDDENVQRDLLPEFRARKNTIAMVTGHAHGYERFDEKGKAFVVTGGGGGPRFPIEPKEKRLDLEEKYQGPALRPFNFVEFSIRESGLHGDVVGLRKGCHRFCRVDRFDLAWPVSGENVPAEPAYRDRNLPDCPKIPETPGCPEDASP